MKMLLNLIFHEYAIKKEKFVPMSYFLQNILMGNNLILKNYFDIKCAKICYIQLLRIYNPHHIV
jgi:hypothetical protein